MTNVLTLSIFSFIIFLTTHLNAQIKFFDQNGKAVSKGKFYKIEKKNTFLTIENDSLKEYRLVRRTEEGEINATQILSPLSETYSLNLNYQQPTLIIYHPGKDKCNSSGSSTSGSKKMWYNDIETKANRIKKVNIIYIFKNNTGLETEKMLPWHKDVDRNVETTFFKYHYPCSSFVIISPNNSYISYFGEFSKEDVYKCLMNLK